MEYLNEYLVLLVGGKIHVDDMNEEEKNQHFYKWGMYLGKLDQTGMLVSGSPLSKTGKIISMNGVNDIYQNLDRILGSYMIIKGKSYEDIEKLLIDCPLLDSESAKIEIRELTPGLK